MFPVSLVLHTHCQGVADDCTVREGPPVMDPWLWKWMRKLEMTVMNSERFLWKTFKLCTASHHSRSLTTVMKATAPPNSFSRCRSVIFLAAWMNGTRWKNWLCVMNACFFSLYTSVRLARFHLWSKVRGFLITVLEPIVRQVDGSTLHRIFCSWCSSEIIFGSPLTNVCQIHKQMHMSDQTGSHQSPCTGFGVGVGQARRKHLPSKENWRVYVTRIRLYHF